MRTKFDYAIEELLFMAMKIIKISALLSAFNIIALVMMPMTYEFSDTPPILPKKMLEGEEFLKTDIGNNSFHMVSSKTNFWCVVKISSKQSINIEDFYFRYWYNQSAFRSREAGSLSMIGNPYQQGSGFEDKRFTAVSNFDDFYIQVGTGPVNWSFQHLRSSQGGFQVSATIGGSFNYLANPSYFVYAVRADEGEMELWINTTGEVNFTVMEGKDVFLYSREDFVGKLNTGCRWGTFMVDGEIQVDIENTFIGWARILGWTGWEKIECITPQGKHRVMTQIDWRGKPVYRNGSLVDPRVLMVGQNGTWIFRMNMVNGGWGGSNVLLFGADVLLP